MLYGLNGEIIKDELTIDARRIVEVDVRDAFHLLWATYDQGIFVTFTHIVYVLINIIHISNIFIRLNEAWYPNIQGKKPLFDLTCKRYVVLHSPSIFQAIESAFHGCLREINLVILRAIFGTII